MKTDRTWYGVSAVLLVVCLVVLLQSHVLSTPQAASQAGSQAAPQRGTISGTVKADQGQVRGFRVTAHNLQYRIWYTVYTNKGRYTIPQALPGLYEVSVIQEGYSSPTLPVLLGPGENKTLDLAISKRADGDDQAINVAVQSDSRLATASARRKLVMVDRIDEMYPPGPGLDLLKLHCTGCHATGFGAMHLTKTGYMLAIDRMMETGPTDTPYAILMGRTVLTGPEREQIADYLAANFGPDSPDRRLRVEPLVADEDAIAKAIFVGYDTPVDMPRISTRGEVIGADMVNGQMPSAPPGRTTQGNYLHDPYIAPDGSIWYGAPLANAVMRLDQKELDPARRWTTYPVQGHPYVFIHGIAVDHDGRVYWAEIAGGQVGELDPTTGKQIRHYVPQRGAMLQVAVDKDNNVWFCNVKGGHIGKIDAKTRKVHQFPTPTPDTGIYGLAVDRQGNVWGAGWQNGIALKFNPFTKTFTEYKPPSAWGNIRRIGVDSKGIAWAGLSHPGMIAAIDPATGRITEYKMLQGASPYDTWPDNNDDIWVADQPHSALAKFDRKTQRFTYYPLPQLRWGIPKMEIEPNNTIWTGARSVPHITAQHFYPNGYTADAPPLP